MEPLKTKEVSKAIGVNPTTIQRWTKFFAIKCEVNEQGHFLYGQHHLIQFEDIHNQLKQGKKLKEVSFPKKTQLAAVPRKQYEAKMEQVFVQVNELEAKLDSKADDVVSYQLLKHRSELDDMMKLLDTLEDRLSLIEKRMSYAQEKRVVNESQELPRKVKKRPWKALTAFFSF